MAAIIDKLILTAGTWDDSGQQDKHLEQQFIHLLDELRIMAKTTLEGAIELLAKHLGEEEVA